MPQPQHYKRGVALLLMAGSCLAARPARVTTEDLQQLADGVRFSATTLGDGVQPADRRLRPVHPSLAHISSWISSVGAGVALSDIDGDGVSNDACLVEPRNDTVTVLPVPGTGDRFARIVLAPPASSRDPIAAPMGCLHGDMDEDGRTDLLVYFWGRTPVAFMNRGVIGRPAFAAAEIISGDERWYTNAAAFADVDGDAHFDLIVGNYFPDGARILDRQGVGYEPMQQSMSRARNGGRKHLLRWDGVEKGMPRFQQVEGWLEPQRLHGWTLALGAADFDGDLRPELYFANDFGPDDVLYNRSTVGRVHFTPLRGRRGWTTPASKVMAADSFKGMGVDFGDINRDGKPDVYVSNIAAEFALEESHLLFLSTNDSSTLKQGLAPFLERSEPLGLSRSSWAWDNKFADFDNDGVLEIVQATGFVKGDVNRWPELHELAMGNDALLRNPRNWPRFEPGVDLSGDGYIHLFRRRDEGRFHEVAAFVGTREPQITRGLAIADVDGDGRLDFAAANQWEPSRFYRNVSVHGNQFLGLHVLFATGSGHDEIRSYAGHPRDAGSPAIGATLHVRLPDGTSVVSHVDGGNGHSGKRSPDVHIGLGALPADRPIEAVLTWRNGETVHRATLALRSGWHTVLLPRH